MIRSDQPEAVNILVVDDTAANLDLLSAMLKEAGYVVRAAPGPELALRSALAYPPTLLLLDIRMPGMDGFEVCRRLKQNARTSDVPIIFVSGQNDVADRVRGFELGGVDFISKPFQREEVLARVRTHLALRQTQYELEQRVRERTAELEKSFSELRKLSMAVDQGPASIVITDTAGRIEYVNQTFVAITGYRAEEAIGQNPSLLKSGKTPPAIYEDLWQTLKRGGVWRGEFINRRSNGEEYTELARISPIRQPDGRITHYLAIKEDITERKALENELHIHRDHLEELVHARTADLKSSEARTRAIVATMLDCVVHIDFRGIILFVNFAVLDMFGYTEEEMVGRNVSMLMPEPLASAHDGYLARYLQTNQTHVIGLRREVTGCRKDGSLFPLELAVNEMVGDAGSTFIGVLRDMSKQKAAEQEVKQALQAAQAATEAKGNFLANMSHEIRTPLNGVLGLAQIGLRDNRGRESADTFRRIRDAGGHLLAVVNDILDFSKIEAGKLKVERRPFALFSIIDNVKSFVASRAEEKGLNLYVSVAPDLSDWVEGDSLRLAQILTNLLSNAIKFTERGEVMLRVARDGDDLYFMVVDSGIGMSEEQLGRLFKSFEQADSSTTRNFGGTGLGLAISRELANLMGGEISVDSRPGEGSSFYLRLPMTATLAPAHDGLSDGASAGSGPRLAGLSVLAADDVEINRFILEDLLAHEGARVVFAEDGQQAIDLLEEKGVSAFDVVLMDVQMPVMDGFEATRRIAVMAPALPVIGLTAHAMAEERDKCLAAGMVDHVGKPVDIEILVEAIRRQVGDEIQAASPGASRGTPAMQDVSLSLGCDDPEIIDLAVLASRVGNDPAKITKFSTLFVETARATLTEMQAALAAGDLAALSGLGHRLKSSALTVGAMRFGALCHELECLKDGNDPVAAAAMIEQLHALFEQIVQRVGKAP